MKMFSLLLVALALLANSSSHANFSVAPKSAAVVKCDPGSYIFYVVGHGANPNRAQTDAYNKMFEIILTIESTTGTKLVDLDIIEEGPIGSTMYFIEFVATFE